LEDTSLIDAQTVAAGMIAVVGPMTEPLLRPKGEVAAISVD
jgi:hypothetical protein